MKTQSQRLLMVAFLAISGFCFWKAATGPLGDKPLPAEAHASIVHAGPQQDTHFVSLGGSHGDCEVCSTISILHESVESQSSTTPIQELRVGMRVVGRNPLAADAQRELARPDPATWRLVRARLEMAPDKFCHVQLLRPVAWLEATEADTGKTVWLDLPEMFVSGHAEVLAIDACPPLEDGTHPIITGTFRHVANQVVELRVAGDSEAISCTSEHPFWSETRQDFVAASQLQVDEEVLTAYGNTARITNIIPRAGPHTVYGLEVYGEHVYGVGQFGLIAHNASGHNATARHINSRGSVLVKAKGFASGRTGRKKPSMLQKQRSHTEHKIARHFGPRLREGHTLDIKGTKPPCQGHRGGCQRVLRHLAQETRAKIKYRYKDDDGRTVRWEAVRTEGGVQVRTYVSGKLTDTRVWDFTQRSARNQYVPF